MSDKQTCILVLGMHRSGTSALTGLLSMFDVCLGSELMQANYVNEKGYFENDILYRLNEQILSDIGSSWDDVFFTESLIEKVNDVCELIKDTIKKEFVYSKKFAIKDPRICLLFPLWEKALNDLNIDIKIIIPYRNPLEVASSLHKRDGMSIEKGMLLWAYHFLLAEKFSRKYDRFFVGFDELVSDAEKVIENISSKFSIDLTKKYQANKKEIDKFIEPGMKHHNISLDNVSENVPTIVTSILSLRAQFNSNNLSSKWDSFRKEVFDYQKLFYNDDIINALAEGQKYKSDLEVTENELDNKIQELNQKDQELNHKHQELNHKHQELADKEETLEDVYKYVSQLESELTVIYTSTSWKVSRPIRVVKRILRRVKRLWKNVKKN